MEIKLNLPPLAHELSRTQQQTGVAKSQESNNRYGSGARRGGDSATLSLEVQLLQPRARLVRETLTRSEKALGLDEDTSEDTTSHWEVIETTLNTPSELTQKAAHDLIVASFAGYLYEHYRAKTLEWNQGAVTAFQTAIQNSLEKTLAGIRQDLKDPSPINLLILQELGETEESLIAELNEFTEYELQETAP